MDNFDWQALFGDLEIEEAPQQIQYGSHEPALAGAAYPPPRLMNAPHPFPVNTPGPRPIQQMSEIERKLAMANTYRLLLEDSIFEDLRDPIVAEVETEIRKFITGQLETLMGGGEKQAAAEERFTPTEVTALKALAKKIIGVYKESKPKPKTKTKNTENAEKPPVPPPPEKELQPSPLEPKLKKRRSPKPKLGRVPPGLEKQEPAPRQSQSTPSPALTPNPPQLPPKAVEGGAALRNRYRKDGTVEQYRPGVAKLPAQPGGFPPPTEMTMAMDAAQKVEQVSRTIGPLLTEAAQRATSSPSGAKE